MDEGFTVPTKDAHTCLEQARLFIRSLGGDRHNLQEVHATFADWVVKLLSKIIDDSKSGGTIDRNDLGISTEYIQHMTLDEENAVRYVAGFVIRAAKDKLKVPNEQEILNILNSMVRVEEASSTSTSSEDWVKSVNRGGLVQITEDAHQLFCAIEYCVRSQLHTSNMCSMDSTFRSRLTNSVLSNSEVQFRWACIGNVDEEAGETCLEMIVHKWITIRGFSFANSVMEQYKQENKKGTAKSKSLRTKLFE